MSQVIASTASLALAVKLKKIFEKEDRYLAFPLGLGFSDHFFEFMKDPTQTSLSAQDQLNYRGEFSRLFNIIPEDKAVFPLDASRFLWDEVMWILNNCIFAESGLTPDEERQLSEAIDFLTDDEAGADGSKVPVNSPQVSRYYEYKTLYEEAERTYLDEKLSVQFAEGPEAEKLKENWNTYRERQLRESRDKAEQDWINLGFKNEVEHYMALKNQLEVRKYLNTYGQAFLDEIKISEISDLNGLGVGFYTTFFSPSDVFNRGLSWSSITLTKAEIDGLLREVPNDLREVFGTDQGSINIEAVSLEYNEVVLIRPWLKTEFFQSRCWKLPDTTHVVSDGGIPCQGTLPAYITNILVVRNVRITRKTGEPTPPLVLPILFKTPIQTLQISKLQVKVLNLAARTNPPKTDPKTIKRDSTFPNKNKHMRLQQKLFSQLRTSFVRPAAIKKKQVAKVGPQTLYAAIKNRRTTILTPRPNLNVIKLQTEGDPRRLPQTSQFVTETFNLDGVSVLALVCKRLPKVPNPDPTLQW